MPRKCCMTTLWNGVSSHFSFGSLSHEINPALSPVLSAREAVLELFCGSVEDPTRLHWPDELLDAPDDQYLLLFMAGLRNTLLGSLFITEKGYIGMKPNATNEGDIVCLIPGCPFPLIVRREG